MIYQPYNQYTNKWTTVDLHKPLPYEMWHWLDDRKGGMYSIFRDREVVKFERPEDASMFILRWL